MGKMSKEELKNIARFGDTVPLLGMQGIIQPNGVNDVMEEHKHKTAKSFLDDMLPNPEQELDTVEQVLLDDDNVSRLYTVVKNNKTGNIIRKSLKDPIDGLKFEDMEKGGLQQQFTKRSMLFEKMRESLDQDGEIKGSEDIGKSWWDSAFEDTPGATFRMGNIFGQLLGGDKNIGRYGGGLLGGDSEKMAYLNKMELKQDGLYYDNQKLSGDVKELEFMQEYLANSIGYKAKGDWAVDKFLGTGTFFETTAKYLTGFAMDFPLFYVSGRLASPILDKLAPAVMGVEGFALKNIPLLYSKGALSTFGTLSLAEAPSMVKHTFEGGVGALADDIKHTAEFSLMAGAFGLGGEALGGGVSGLLRRGSLLNTSELAQVLRKNPQVTKTVAGGITSGMLGYTVGGETYEEKLATGLTFMSMHFVNPKAWRTFLSSKEKSVMVENDTFADITKKTKDGMPLRQAFRETGSTVPRYFYREGNKLYEMHSEKFSKYGEVEYVTDTPIELTNSSGKNYKYISEAIPFQRKTLSQAWKDEELRITTNKVKDKYFKNIKNPYEKGTDEWTAFEFNKNLTVKHIANMVYANDLTTELRRNTLPADVKLKEFVNTTSNYFDLSPRTFERHLSSEVINHLKDPKSIDAKYQFMPEEYRGQFEKGLGQLEKSIYNEITRQEVESALTGLGLKTSSASKEKAGMEKAAIEDAIKKASEATKPAERKRPLDVKEYPFKKASETKKKTEGETEIPIVEVKPKAGQNELVDESGNPLTKKLTWREQYERDRQQGKVVPMKAGTPVDKYDLTQIKDLNSLNKALEEVDNPRALMDRIKAEAEEQRVVEEAKLAEEKPAEKPIVEEKPKVTPVEEVVTREQGISKSREKQAKLERELLDIQEKMAKSGMTEEQIKSETYENPESAAGKKLAEIFNEDAARHVLQNPVEVGKGEFKAVKLASGEVITFKEAGGHLAKEFAKLPKEVRDTIVDTGVTNERNEFKSTAVVKIEDYKQALDNIAQRLLKGGGGSTVVEGAKGGIFSPDMLRDLVTVGVHHFERGLTTFKDWSRRVLKDLGNRFKPYLTKLWQSTLDFLKTGIKDIPPSDENTFGMFLGQMATSFGEAKRKGKVYEEGKEQKFFISDKDAKVGLVEGADFVYRVKGKTFKDGAIFNLTDMLDHPKLYANYPDLLNDWKVQLVRGKSDAVASISVADRKIKLNLDNVEDVNSAAVPMVIKNSMLHEIQHFIQDKEGWALGSGSNYNLYEMSVALDKLARHLESRKNDEGITWDAIRMNFSNRQAYTNAMLKGIEAIKRGDNLVGEQGAKIFKAIENEIYNLSKGEIEARLTEAISFFPEMEAKYAEKAFEVQLKEEGVNPENVIIDRGRKAGSEIVYSGNEPVIKEKKGERTREEEKTYEKIQGLFKTYRPKNISGKLKGTTLDPESYAQMNNLNTLAKMKPEEIDVYKEQISRDLAKLEEKRTSEEITHEQYEEMESLAAEAFTNLDNFGNLEGKRGAELQNTLGELKTVITEGKTRHKILEDARKARMDTLRDIVKTSMGNKEILSETQARIKGIDAEASNLKEGVLKGLSDAENTYLFGLGHILQKMFSSDYRAGRYIMERTKQAEGKEADGLDKWEQTVQAKVKEIYSLEGKDLLKALEKNKEIVKDSEVYIGKDQMPLTQNEAYKKYMEWQDKKYGEPTLRKMGFTDETIAQIEKFMTPEVKKWADWQVKEFYSEYYKPVNEVYRRMYYVNLPQHENYSPLKRNVSRVQEDNLMKTSMNPIASALNYSLYHRTNSRQDLSYVDGDQVLMSHIAQMEHFKAWGEHIRELRSILQHSEIKNVIKQNYGDNYNVLVNNYINDLARGSVLREKVYPLLDKIRNNFTTAVLSIPKLNLFPQQLSSMAMYATKIPTAEFLSGFTDMLSNPMEAYKILYENSANFRARYKQGFDRDIKDVMALKDVQKLAGVRSLKDALMFAVKMGDKFAVVGGGYSVWKYHYEKAIRDGLSPEEAMQKAINKFDVATDETQQSSKLIDLSDLQRGGSLGKLFTMFQSQPNLYYRATSMAVRDLIRHKGEPRQHIKTILLAHFALPMLFQFISDFGWDTKHQIRAGAIGSFNGIFALGDFISNTVSALQNDLAFGIESVPIMDAPNKFFEAAKVIGKMSDDGEIDMGEVLKVADKLASGTSRFMGIPYDPTKKVFAGAGVKANKEGIQYSTENINLKRLMGVSELAIKDNEAEMKEAKRRMTIYKKKYQKTSDSDDRSAYIEARREYERMVKELKLNERKK